jgi:hypothetical protein
MNTIVSKIILIIAIPVAIAVAMGVTVLGIPYDEKYYD